MRTVDLEKAAPCSRTGDNDADKNISIYREKGGKDEWKKYKAPAG